MRDLLLGVLVTTCVIAALFFFQFWRSSRDRLFAFFSIAFSAMAVDWFVHVLAPPSDLARAEGYLIRLFAFAVIIVGIVDKNRRAGRERR
ncbi:MAG TPA: DUF5985 family protein [Steroidobacteraceae bacterium]|nr:DUF5985 family protein [Steroidobacteraceae bacterium]